MSELKTVVRERLGDYAIEVERLGVEYFYTIREFDGVEDDFTPLASQQGGESHGYEASTQAYTSVDDALRDAIARTAELITSDWQRRGRLAKG